jgi:hypothetical protein
MTYRPALDERDPLPPRVWTEASSAGIRRLALDAAREAVERARDSRKKPTEERE